MNSFGIVIIFVISIVSSGLSEVLIDEATSISIVEDVSDKTISGTDVSDVSLFPASLRRNWCSVVNSQLNRRFGIRNTYIESMDPGRGFTYEINVNGSVSYVYGFVCPGENKSFLVVAEQYISPTSYENIFHGYTPSSSCSSITKFTGDHLEGIFGLRAH